MSGEINIWDMSEDQRRAEIVKRAASGARRALGLRDYIRVEPTPKPIYPRPAVGPISLRLPTWRRILAEVAIAHGIPPILILGRQRRREIMAARHELMYRLSTETTMSLSAIGKKLDRDHTTVLSGIKAHKRRHNLDGDNG
ncbi:helix-turn-helix domain-containing protein [Devosia sp.]|uniref:helix-turn-helix domain-containing protein n=1 Tax=Devosia sp. TaxID=1871048 RepID=UPI002AFFC7D6|nr:helix-turn-helix domain-containing protein [Devosia sp.]